MHEEWMYLQNKNNSNMTNNISMTTEFNKTKNLSTSHKLSVNFKSISNMTPYWNFWITKKKKIYPYCKQSMFIHSMFRLYLHCRVICKLIICIKEGWNLNWLELILFLIFQKKGPFTWFHPVQMRIRKKIFFKRQTKIQKWMNIKY